MDLEANTGGFLVAPFNNPERSREILIKSDIYYCSQPSKITTGRDLTVDGGNIMDQFQQEIKQTRQAPAFYHRSNGNPSTSDASYQQTVEAALQAISNGDFQKVVPAALRSISISDDFDPLKIFDKLCQSYPSAFVSLISTPETGTWMGASPEALIEVEDSKTFTTVAVAGTQAYRPGTSIQDVAWRQKEIEEQALVSRYIINCFKKIRLREFEELGPKTVVAGNLLHLKTTYAVDMKETNFPLLGGVMLDLLHPTSAVWWHADEASS